MFGLAATKMRVCLRGSQDISSLLVLVIHVCDITDNITDNI